ncbi:MAG: hypothetical protein COC23_06655 [Hyphomicrobiales bacterium]|nr:MAG: hypothetical protein COC23_06655 [Hyphomicrobiales bacterium]
MKLYRLITGPDDATFCHRVTKAVSNDWKLAGSPALTYNADTKQNVCAQAVTKDVPGEDYHEDIKLSEY